MQGRATYMIPGGAKAPIRVREIVSLTVGASLPKTLVDQLKLLASEVVTNSVIHGESGSDREIEVAVAWNPQRIRLEVADDGPGFRYSEPDPERPGGWGLHLVEAMSDRWGIERANRTRVWFELSTEAGL